VDIVLTALAVALVHWLFEGLTLQGGSEASPQGARNSPRPVLAEGRPGPFGARSGPVRRDVHASASGRRLR
jgi:hypothetical protein